MKEYIKVCELKDLSEKKGLRFFADENTDIAVFLIKGKIYAFDNVCPHNHTPKIHLGYIENDNIICPVHFFKFNIESGKHQDGAVCSLRVFEVKLEGEEVYVEKPESKTFNFDF